ncbi:MAG: hypothetical protein ACRDQ5_21425, partial [Sciscionella sp.]
MQPQTRALDGAVPANAAVDPDRSRPSSGPRSVLILGSTGSIGTQALEVIAANPELFTVAGLAAGGANAGLLADQALRFGVRAIAVASATAVEDVQLGLYTEARKRGYDRGELRLPKVFG